MSAAPRRSCQDRGEVWASSLIRMVLPVFLRTLEPSPVGPPTVGTFVRKRRGGERSAGHSTTWRSRAPRCYKNVQNIFVSQCKRYISKEGKGSAVAPPPLASPRWVRDPTVEEGGPFARPPINNRQKQVYSHRQVAAVS